MNEFCRMIRMGVAGHVKLQLHDAIYRLRFYSNSLIHILSLSNLHNNVASIQKNRGNKSHRVIVALEEAEQRPMNNEYVTEVCKYHELVNCHDLGWHFKISQLFVNIANKKPRGQPSDVIVPDFPLRGKRNYVVEEFSTKHQRAIIT